MPSAPDSHASQVSDAVTRAVIVVEDFLRAWFQGTPAHMLYQALTRGDSPSRR